MSPAVVATPQLEVLATSTVDAARGRAQEVGACAGAPGGATLGQMVASIRLR